MADRLEHGPCKEKASIVLDSEKALDVGIK